MLKNFKRSAHEFSQFQAGERFESRYRQAREAGHGMLRRCVVVSLGIFVFLLGIAFVPAPGPGLLIMVIGASLVAQESRSVAVRLDRGELWLRQAAADIRRYWKRKATASTKFALVLTAIGTLAGLVAAGFQLLQA